MNSPKVAAALRALADAIDDGGRAAQEETDALDAKTLAEGAKAAPQKRGRGRPVKGEETAAPAPAPAPAPVEADPFGDPPVSTAPNNVTTLSEVREALTALRAATNQDIALTILKIHGKAANVTELAPELYGTVVAAAKARAAESVKAPVAEADPFGETTAAAPTKPLTLEDVKAEVVAAQKRTSQDTVQKIVMAHGGKGPKPDGSGEGPSLKALPESQFAATIAALKALPSTK